MPSRIIILNGTSSSGKSTIARELKNILTDFYHLGIDDFLASAPNNFYVESDDNDVSNLGFQSQLSEDKTAIIDYTINPKGFLLIERIHAAVSAFCNEEVNVIFETVIANEQMLGIMARHFSKHQVFLVGVRCSEEERKRREIERGNRLTGTYNLKADYIYNKCEYDIEVDTTSKSAIDLANEIKEQITKVSPSVLQNFLKNNHPK